MENLDSASLYFKEIGDIPLLSKEEFRDLIPLAQKGNVYAKQRLIESNLKLVVSIAKKYLYRQSVLDLLDLIAEGTLGLIHAIKKYRLKYGYEFSTYAYWWIKQSIQKALLNQVKMIHISSYTTAYIKKVIKCTEELRAKLERVPSSGELAKELNTSTDKVEKILKDIKVWENVVSLDKPLDDNEEIFLKDIVLSPDLKPEEHFEMEARRKKIEKIMKYLTKREQNILKQRSGYSGGKPAPLSLLAKKYKITRERIRQLEKRALQKMKRYLIDEGIEF
ncbi:MAG: RNA polymerase sigma factor RpoD/SigA [bacterium]